MTVGRGGARVLVAGSVLALAAASCVGTTFDGRTDAGSDGGPDSGDADHDTDDGRDPVDPSADADGDTIADVHEGTIDSDGDGAEDRLDLDSDGDGIADGDEAGDADVLTAPLDSDGDALPDFRDLDSDNDGVSDADESAAGTSPRDADTDGDGAEDVVEMAAGTDPLGAADNPVARGNFVFVVPYEAPPDPESDSLVFGTEIQKADVYFIVDRSASMRDEQRNLRQSLRDTIVPAVNEALHDVWIGAGIFDLCPMVRDCVHEETTPVWIRNLQVVASDPALTQAALDGLSGSCDGTAEPYITTLWVIATDDENGPADDWAAGRVAPTTCPSEGGYVGYPCFRDGAVPIVVMFGDEDFYSESYRGCDPSGGRAPDFDAAVGAFEEIHARFIGISSNSHDTDTTIVGFRDMSEATGSVDASGRPLSFHIASDGTGLGTQVVEAIETLAEETPMDISARAIDVDEGPADSVDATVFVDRIVPSVEGGEVDPRDATMVCVGGLPVSDEDGDSTDDTFPGVRPGTVVCFDIYARENRSVPATTDPQLFRAEVQVIGEDVTALDRRDVYFLVPPETYVGAPD